MPSSYPSRDIEGRTDVIRASVLDQLWRTPGAHLDGKRREMWGRRQNPEGPILQAVPAIACPSQPACSHPASPRQGGGHWFEPSIAHRRKALPIPGFWLFAFLGPSVVPVWFHFRPEGGRQGGVAGRPVACAWLGARPATRRLDDPRHALLRARKGASRPACRKVHQDTRDSTLIDRGPPSSAAHDLHSSPATLPAQHPTADYEPEEPASERTRLETANAHRAHRSLQATGGERAHVASRRR